MIYKYNETTPEEFLELATRCGRKYSEFSVQKAWANTLFMVGLYEEDMLCAFGRICGDGALYYIIGDVMVDPACAELHLEVHVLKKLNDYLREEMARDSQVLVHVARPYDIICRKYGFKYPDSDYELIMKR